MTESASSRKTSKTPEIFQLQYLALLLRYSTSSHTITSLLAPYTILLNRTTIHYVSVRVVPHGQGDSTKSEPIRAKYARREPEHFHMLPGTAQAVVLYFTVSLRHRSETTPAGTTTVHPRAFTGPPSTLVGNRISTREKRLKEKIPRGCHLPSHAIIRCL